MPLAALILFLVTTVAIVAVWNAVFTPVRTPVVVLLLCTCMAYLAPTLFTNRVDVPGGLAYVAYPWKASGTVAVRANTGIVFTQIAPWTHVARELILRGEMPMWNRASGSGSPLLANQQTAIFHPFTLLGLPLSLGKAFTLTAALRLFTIAFFSFLLLRNFGLGEGSAVFGALAYTFCTFHIVWLLFPLGLSSMMLPLCLVGVQELLRAPRIASYGLLLAGLSASVLGGHPESALWVWLATAGFVLYQAWCIAGSAARRAALISLGASAFVFSMLLTAWWWYPTMGVLPVTPRFHAHASATANPTDHGLTYEWLLPLIAPNVLGNPTAGTYTPPRGFHPAVLNDYGEVASSYAGLATLALAVAAPFVGRMRRTVLLSVLLMVFSILTFGEAPYWRELIRALPLAGISIHQRLRLFWDLGVCIAAAVTLQAAIDDRRSRKIVLVALLLAVVGFTLVYALRHAPLVDTLARVQFAMPILSVLLVGVALLRGRRVAAIATVATVMDLVAATWHYNPSSAPSDLYPRSGAIAALQSGDRPYRIAAMGWSLLAETPAMYGLEDVKTTDPIQHARYMRLLKGYLAIDPGSYDLVIGDTHQPFFDYLNIQYVYTSPGQLLSDPDLVKVYAGADGEVYRNTAALPRYFFVSRFRVDPDFDHTVWASREIADFSREAIVDHIPLRVAAADHSIVRGATRGGAVRLLDYGPNRTQVHVESKGWNLFVTSEVSWPGWRVYWNGKRQPPVVVNGAFLGCFVPPGRGLLELKYSPAEFDVALRALAVGVIGLALLATIAMHRRRRVE